MSSAAPRILLTGGTGYVGGRLLRALEERGEAVRCLARDPRTLASKVGEGTTAVQGDVLTGEGLAAACEGVETAYYLVHSMGAKGSFEEEDRRAAANFAAAAKEAGVARIVYLGGLGDEREDLSPHLRSRHEVGRVLASTGVPTVEFRASIVIGSGSLSFEMVRALVERLPFMVAPRWVGVQAQPIGIEDLVAYLLAALEIAPEQAGVYEIGGADRMSYADLMRAYGEQRGMRVRLLSVPWLTPSLSSLWLGLVTPLYARVGRKLISSVTHPTVVTDHRARQVFDLEPVGVAEAIRRALQREDQEFAVTRWTDALSSAGRARTWAGVKFGNRLVDSRTIEVAAAPPAAFAPVQRIGGARGWYAWNFLWRIRGALDLLLGGVGMRRGRQHPVDVRVGDAIDFWRVEGFESDRKLRLHAEMKVPGRAWLEFEVSPAGEGRTTLRQTAIFDPMGWLGRLYWYALYPLHFLVFRGMLRGLARAATTEAAS